MKLYLYFDSSSGMDVAVVLLQAALEYSLEDQGCNVEAFDIGELKDKKNDGAEWPDCILVLHRPGWDETSVERIVEKFIGIYPTRPIVWLVPDQYERCRVLDRHDHVTRYDCGELPMRPNVFDGLTTAIETLVQSSSLAVQS